MSGGIELASLQTKIKVNIADFKNDMDKVKTEAISRANQVSKEMTSTLKVGETLSKVGSQATKFLTIPLLNTVEATGKISKEFSQKMSMISTLLDGSVEQIQKRTNELKDSIIRISNDTGMAIRDIADGAYQVVMAYGDTADSIKILETVTKSAKASSASTINTINLLSAVTKNYGDTSAKANQKASDLAIMTAKLGQTTFPELASSIGVVVPLAKNLKVSQEELFSVMATGTSVTGNASEVIAQFKGILQGLMTPTKEMANLMKRFGYESGQAMIENEGLQRTIDTVVQAAKDSEIPFQSYIETIEGQTLALALSGEQHDSFIEKLSMMNDVAGSTEEVYKKVSDTVGAKFQNSLNKTKNATINFKDSLGPLIEKGADLLGKLTNKIGDLSPKAFNSISKMDGMAAAIKPLLKVTGSLASIYGELNPLISEVTSLFSVGSPSVGEFASSLFSTLEKTSSLAGLLPDLTDGVGNLGLKMMDCGGVVGKVGTAMAGAATSSGGLLASIGTLATSALPWVAGAAAIGAAAYGIYKIFDKDVIPEVDLFKDRTTVAFDEVTGAATFSTVKISEGTQQQIQSYIDLSDNVQQESTNMYLGITKITDENIASIIQKTDKMADSIISSTEKQKNGVTGKYKKMFNETSVISSSEQQEILTTVQRGYNDRVAKTKALQKQLTDVYTTIKNQGGDITRSQQLTIDDIYDQMKEQAVASMTKSKAEQEVILNNLNTNSTRITADMAGKAIKEMNKIETESINSAKNKRDELVRQASELAMVEGGKYKEKADEIIKQANREYKDTVAAAGKTKKEGIDKLMTAHQNLADSIDISSGEVVSGWDKMFGKWDRWEPEEKTAKITTVYVDRKRGAKTYGNTTNSFMANGYDYIPFDGYNARLHEGERVLTKKENKEYTDSKLYSRNSNGRITIKIPFEINGKEFAIATKDFMAEELGF